jgi:hypothetical protein
MLTTDGKKNSRLTTKISRFLRFAQTKNLEIFVSQEMYISRFIICMMGLKGLWSLVSGLSVE